MKKKIIPWMMFVFAFCMLFSFCTFASSQTIPSERTKPRLVDDAGLLTESETSALQTKLDQLSESLQMDIVIYTTNSLNDKNIMEVADDYYDYSGFGYGKNRDGCVLVVAMDTRKWWISTCGRGISVFDDDTIQKIGSAVANQLGSENYYAAFDLFAKKCETAVLAAKDREKTRMVLGLVISLVVGFVIALIATSAMKSKLRSVAYRSNASEYVKRGSMNLTHSSEHFLYSHVTQTEIPKDSGSSSGSSTHVSSSGTSHGGGGGSF